jgi:para-aminobenzoate synthetase component 1
MSPKLPPLCHELAYLADGSLYFEAMADLEWPVFLDSTQKSSHDNRYDIIAANPFSTIVTEHGVTSIFRDGVSTLESENDPFTVLSQQLNQYAKQNKTDLPFCGGAIGLFGYDLGRYLESLPKIAKDGENIPDMLVGLYDWAIINDHAEQRSWLASFGLNENTRLQWPQLINRFSHIQHSEQEAFSVSGPLTSNLARDQYQIAFDKIQHYILEGDCYQVNLTKRFEIQSIGAPWSAYKLLRQQNPAPFSVYFETPHVNILSSSPERLLHLQDKHVETKPIKGTRSRDLNDPDKDQKLADELQTSVKDRAENLMIVDLLRNDIGKVCEPGSIAVPKPFALESFATVHHLVSTITGSLSENQDAISLLRACFPGGSITGAPKLRAMEIIEELEPDRRGAYCGSIAYIGFDGNMDSNILIRTLVHSGNRLRFWAGGGIVADSNADDEYQEIHDKAAALINLIESLY